MAQVDHLPIYRAAYDLCLHLEQAVRKFCRYQKHTVVRIAAREPGGC